MARNNSNKKSTNNMLTPSDMSRLQQQVLVEMRRKSNSSGKQRRKGRNNGQNSTGALIARPAAYSRPVRSSIPKTISRGGTHIIRFKEFVQDIAGSTGFVANTFTVNPGIPTLFAWLSGQALFYQEYRFRMLRFCYETEKSTATSGKVIYAFQQDSSDSAPASKQEMLENQYKSGGAPWEPFSLNVNGDTIFALGKARYIRGGTLAANLDQKTYDIGQLIVATQGMADTTNVGELYVEYEIELFTPIQSAQQFASALSKVVTGGTGILAAVLWGTVGTLTAGSLDVTAAVNTLTFNRVGRYFVEVSMGGTGLHTSFIPVIAASTGTVVLINGISNAAGDAGLVAVFSATIVILVRGQTAVFDCTTMATTITSSFGRIAGFSST